MALVRKGAKISQIRLVGDYFGKVVPKDNFGSVVIRNYTAMYIDISIVLKVIDTQSKPRLRG